MKKFLFTASIITYIIGLCKLCDFANELLGNKWGGVIVLTAVAIEITSYYVRYEEDFEEVC